MGNETRKCYEKRLRRGDFEKYLLGRGLDVGCGPDPLTAPQAAVDPWDLGEGDGEVLSAIKDGTYDFVYSSHCLEHLRSVETALSNWARALKTGGALYVVVPDYTLYEKETFPSRYNSDHKHTFSLHISRKAAGRANHWNIKEDLAPLLRSLGIELVESFLEDDHYDYGMSPEKDQTHFPQTLAQITIIGRKTCSTPDLRKPVSSPPAPGPVSRESLRIYTGILGQIGDIVMFTPTARRLKELFPHSKLTFAIARKYEGMADLIRGLPYVDRIFLTECYFERLTPHLSDGWFKGWPVDLRGDDEVQEQRHHDLIFETRPRSKRSAWWEHAHQVEESAHRIGVPGPIDLQTEISIPVGVEIPEGARGKIVLHNDPAISPDKAWNWELLRQCVTLMGPQNVVLLGNPGPPVGGVFDLRGKTTLAQAAAIIRDSECYVGIDSGLMWIAGSLQVPAVGLYGTTYIRAYGAIHPKNPNATYLQVEGSLDSIASEAVAQAVRERRTLGKTLAVEALG